jgi:hypothetical protein
MIVSDIIGPQEVYPYEIYDYQINDLTGSFSVDAPEKAKILEQQDGKCSLEIIASKKGKFNLSYNTDNTKFVLPITILSL